MRSPLHAMRTAALLLACTMGVAPRVEAGTHVEMRWESVPGAVGYELQIAEDPEFRTLVRTDTTTEPRFAWTDLPDRTVWWRVRCVYSFERRGLWSAARPIEAASGPAEAHAPRHGATVSVDAPAVPVSFSWHSPAGTREHILEIAREESFETLLETRTVTQRRAIVPLTGTGTVFWRVIAIDGLGRRHEPSATRSLVLSLAAPSPLAPDDGAAIELGPDAAEATIELSWRGHGIAGFQVELTIERDGAAPGTMRLAASSPVLSFPGSAGIHTWRVRALDESGAPGPWSVPRRFDVRAAPPPPAPEETPTVVAAADHAPPEPEPDAAPPVESAPPEAGPTPDAAAATRGGHPAPALTVEPPSPPSLPGRRLAFEAGAGWTSNFGWLSAPRARVGIAGRARETRPQWLVTGELGWLAAEGPLTLRGERPAEDGSRGRPHASLRVAPLLAGVRREHGSLRAGASAGLAIAHTRLTSRVGGAWESVQVVPAASLSLGVSVPLRRNAVALDVSWSRIPLRGRLRGDAGGATVQASWCFGGASW